jgi:two-component system sensor histidine kinase BaeS
MPDRRLGLGPLGRRLLVAFVVVALSSVAVLTIAALIGTSRGINAAEESQREAAATATASAASEAYREAGGWNEADLGRAETIAAASGARLVVSDANGSLVLTPNGGSVPGVAGPAAGGGMGRGAVAAPVVLDGQVVGTVRLAFGPPAQSTGQQIAWTWILIAAGVAVMVAIVVAWFVTWRVSAPLVRLAEVANAFAAGDRSVRPTSDDVEAPGELGDLARAFDATANAVVLSEHARRAMSADIAHELRTPLAALQAGLEELHDGLVEPDPRRLAALHAQSIRLGRIVGDLAELSAAEAAVLALRRAPINLSALAADAVAAAEPALVNAGLRVTTDLSADVTVDGDADRLHQAIGNLLSNAVRHCRAGDSVAVSLSTFDRFAVLSVADTGPGVSAADRRHVFERLWRGQADAGGAGMGIGLAVVKELVVAHGGTAAVATNENGGATFTLRLPLSANG